MLTRRKLEKLDGEDRLLAVVEAAASKRRRLRRSPERLDEFEPRGQRHVALYYLLDSQVRRGGLSRFFRRTSGEFNDAVIDALAYIGARQTRGVVEEAMRRFERHGERLRPRLRAADEVDISAEFCTFRDLDERYEEVLEDVDALVLKRISERPDDFVDESLLQRFLSLR